MSRTPKAMESEVTFGEWEEPETVNPFADKVADFLKRAESNPKTTLAVTVDVADEKAAKVKIQKAANALGKTAKHRLTNDDNVKVVGKDEDGDDIVEGKVTLIFTAAPLHKARGKRGPAKPKAEAESAEASA